MNKSSILTALLLTILSTALIAPAFVIAQEVAPKRAAAEKKTYHPATLTNISRLYWALDRLDIEDDDYVNNYMFINECEIYQEYFYNEFQWGSVQQYARDYIGGNKEKFPVRIEFVQALRLGGYDFDKQAFTILPKYAINGIRRFEVETIDIKQDVCGLQHSQRIKGYPKAILLEISRPIVVDSLPMPFDAADKYIQEKTAEFKKLSRDARKRSSIYNFRDIYIVFNVKFFSSAGDFYSQKQRTTLAKLLGVLESYEVYDDIGRKKLLYRVDYQKKKKKDKKPSVPTKEATPANVTP